MQSADGRQFSLTTEGIESDGSRKWNPLEDSTDKKADDDVADEKGR
jgi:hypothetical protein